MGSDDGPEEGPGDGPDCPFCQKAFDSLAALEEHIEDEHREDA